MSKQGVHRAATWVVAAAALIGIGGVAGFGVAAHEQLSALQHAPAYALPTPQPALAPASPEPTDRQLLIDALTHAAAHPDLGEFHARVTDAGTGEVVFEQHADEPLRPASTTKILTASAAILELGPRDTIETVAYRDGDTAVIKAAGDVWLGAEAIDELAAQLSAQGPFAAVTIDTDHWAGMPELLPGWDPVDVDGGFVAPLQPAMLNGGRGLEETTGDVPRSHAPALDVAWALAQRIGAGHADYGHIPAGAEPIARVESPDLVTRLATMMKTSDNVYAEAIGRELALHRGTDDAPSATMGILQEHGFDTAASTIHDNSGLSELNLITPALLDSLLAAAATGDELRPLLATLPVAAGEGTLASRYGDLEGRGWVRAKTGTLDETSGLAGTVTSVNGNVYTFALLSNDSSILEARRAMDEFTSVLRDF